MRRLEPNDLFEHAERLITPSRSGMPQEADIRRAISASYYGLFHAVCTEAADHFVGSDQRGAAHYVHVHRSIDHRDVLSACHQIELSRLDTKLAGLAPPGGFTAPLKQFATAARSLQEKRHRADYHPDWPFRTVDARLAISEGRSASEALMRCSRAERIGFLTLLLFKRR